MSLQKSSRPKALLLENVSKRYGENGAVGPAVLAGLNCAVAPGEFLCILGPSGCGKTTLLHLIAGFIAPSAGRVLCGGEPVTGASPDRAMVFQEPTLFPWLTVRGNVEFGLRQAGLRGPDLRSTAMRHLETMGLADHAAKHPHALSGGMRQRVALARVLALKPSVLLLDEPFSALDVPTRERLQDELLTVRAARECTIVYVTHSVEEAAYLGDRILVFSPDAREAPREAAAALPRPRRRSGAEVWALEASLRTLLHEAMTHTS